MNKIINLIMKNPVTSASFILVWIIFFLSYAFFHYSGINTYNKAIISLLMSFVWFVLMAFVTVAINLPFDSSINKFLNLIQPLLDILDKKFPLPNLPSSGETSALFSKICFVTFVHALIAFLICYYQEYPFKKFIYIFLIMSSLKLAENIFLTILMNKIKTPIDEHSRNIK